jgi:moderate conductance mechanosensitive channel
MQLKRYQAAIFFSFLVLVAFLTAGKAYGQEKEGITTKEVQGVVDLIEDPNRRAVLVKALKNLIRAKEAAMGKDERTSAGPGEKKGRELLLIEQFFSRFQTLATGVVGSAASTASLVAKAPLVYERVKSFLSEHENRSKLLKLLADILAGIVIALLLRFFLQRFVPKTVEGPLDFINKLTINAAQVLFALIPYGVLLASLFILFKLLPSFPLGHSMALILFTILFFYHLALKILRALISPDAAQTRILPINDETANYYWIWGQRFAHYTAIYFVVVQSLNVVQVDPASLAFIRGVFLVIFAFVISVFIMQVAREMRARYENARGEGGDKALLKRRYLRVTQSVVRYWALLAIAYAWVIFLFELTNYEMGFSYLIKATFFTVLIILALILSLHLQERLFKKFFAVSEKVKERFPGLEEKTNRYIMILRKTLRAIFFILATGVAAEVWGIPVSEFVASKAGALIILRAVAITITVGVVFAVFEVTSVSSVYLLKEKKKGKKKKTVSQKAKTLIPIVRTSVNIAAGFIGGIVILDRLGVNTTPILAGAGIVGLAVGFGAQTLVKAIINGLFILFEESLRVGDYAVLGKNEGIVEAVGLRTVKLRDVKGNFHVVPNSSISTITNMSKDFSRTVIDVGVAYREDVDEVMEILRAIGEEMQNDPEYGKNILEPIEIFGLHKFDDSAIIVRSRLTTKPLKQWGVKREFNRRVKKVFDARGIEIPFPHRTVYMGEPKQGAAPSLNVQLEQKSGSPA